MCGKAFSNSSHLPSGQVRRLGEQVEYFEVMLVSGRHAHAPVHAPGPQDVTQSSMFRLTAQVMSGEERGEG